MNVEYLMAARQRLLYGKQRTLAGALSDKPDDDPEVVVREEAETKHRGGSERSPVDAIELMIAQRVDRGEELPIANAEGFEAARWIAQAPLADLPEELDPFPRPFVLYLALAYQMKGDYPDLETALDAILTTRGGG